MNLERLWEVLRVIGAREADAEGVKSAVRQAFERQLPWLVDPSRFWAVRSFVTEGLNYPSLAAFLGQCPLHPTSTTQMESSPTQTGMPGGSLRPAAMSDAPTTTGEGGVSLCLPVLEVPSGGAGGPLPKLLIVEPESPPPKLVLPTFLGLPLGPLHVGVQTASWTTGKAPRGGKGEPPGALVRPPTSFTSWNAGVRWEAGIVAEVGVDGGSNRNWKALFGTLPPEDLVTGILTGLKSSNTTREGRADFVSLLEAYLKKYPEVFTRIRASHRVSNTQILNLARDPGYATTPKGRLLRCVSRLLEPAPQLAQSPQRLTPPPLWLPSSCLYATDALNNSWMPAWLSVTPTCLDPLVRS